MRAGVFEARCSEHRHDMTARSRRVVICLAGLTACGKSTVAKRLAEKFGLRYVSGGMALKGVALKLGYRSKGRGWWESAEGLRFLEQRSHDPRFDERIDAELLKLGRQGNVVFDSWTMPWLSKTGFKIWLEVTAEERARRLTKRDGIGLDEAKRVIKEKDGRSRRIYEHLYGFKLGEDYTPFDLVLDSESLSSDEVFDVLRFAVERLVFEQCR